MSNDDIFRALKKLKILGSGFSVIPLDSGRHLVQSVPGEFSMDATAILQRAEANGGQVTLTSLADDLGWERGRGQRALDQLTKDGLVWVDEQEEGEPSYWFASIFQQN